MQGAGCAGSRAAARQARTDAGGRCTGHRPERQGLADPVVERTPMRSVLQSAPGQVLQALVSAHERVEVEGRRRARLDDAAQVVSCEHLQPLSSRLGRRASSTSERCVSTRFWRRRTRALSTTLWTTERM
eukprot:scaffold5534_cov71-Phaeocystis_antarctica.AAC.2